MRSVRLLRKNVLRAFKPSSWNSSQSRKIAGISSVPKEESFKPDPYEGNFSFADCDQYTKVTLIGAAGRVGRTLSLLLKTCPLVDHLCLFDIDKSVKGIGVDISHVDTKCCVSYVCGMKNIQKALDAPDVVVIAAGCPASPQLSGKKLFDKNAPIVAGLSEACARFCPKACIVLITNPINSLVPVVGEVYQMITNRMPSRKLFGLTTLDVVRANTFVAEVVRKDPNNVIVPVVGGTSQETIVPVISQMKPCCRIKRGEVMALTECLKRAEGNLADCQNCGTRGASSLSTAYAAFRFTSSLVMALKGAQDVIECAYVKSNIIPELEYLASPLKLGICGIEHNFGYPQLSDSQCVTNYVELNKPIALEEKTKKTVEDAPKKLKSFRHGNNWLNGTLLSRENQAAKSCRMYHTGLKNSFRYSDQKRSRATEKYKRYLMEDRMKSMNPMKALNILKCKTKNIQNASEKSPWDLKFERTHYKLLNASAKQKYRSFNMQKKFSPSASVLLLTERRKRLQPEKIVGLTVKQESDKIRHPAVVKAKGAEEEEVEEEVECNYSTDIVKAEEDNEKKLVPAKKEADDLTKYKDYILKQLQELKRENEDLKRRLLQIMENKKLETALQVQTDNLELEKTKLKACWLVMSSTMDAVSNFCRKFTSKSDSQFPILKEEEEATGEFEDAVEVQPDKKGESYDEKYYNFLSKLMQDQVEEEKARNRVGK